MKGIKWFFGAFAALAMLGFATVSQAQIWSHYDMRIDTKFFNPLPTGTTVDPLSFTSFTGANDLDDGVSPRIWTQFRFDFNGNMYDSINVCINGWLMIGQWTIPTITNDKYFLFRPNEPNNTIAPFFGDHYLRTLADVINGYKISRIWYNVVETPDPNPTAFPGATLHEFTMEWKDLNINDKLNPNSIATFQVKIIENPMANDQLLPDKRATIEFNYGPIGNQGNVKTQGCTVGIEDSIGYSHMNGLFPSSFAGEDSTRLNVDSLTTCWPPASCLPGRVIRFEPEGTGKFAQWGDGDANLTQSTSSDPAVVFNQNRFVTLADADFILGSIAQAYPPMDSVEGRNAFHGDVNHNGRYQLNPFQPYYFYKVTSYDAAYILMYLAAKIPFLPWLGPVPAYKQIEGSANPSITGIALDASQATKTDRTVLVPVVLHGSANGPLSFECNVSSQNPSNFQFIGAETKTGMIYGNAKTGKVTFAASGVFADGTILGYLTFIAENGNASSVDLTNITINDEQYPAAHSTIDLGVSNNTSTGFHVEQVVPNPFSVSTDGSTAIVFSNNEASTVSLRVFDLLGKEVYSTSAQTFGAGQHHIEWNGHDNSGVVAPAGVYYYNLSAGQTVLVGKINLMQ
ncbi:MAG TPA: FlgD immunoglobulin-like domain containing protein [Candidatus Kapabacteria bacterium]|nr:FlgD immunoglobulin-like domain containing protein [Candidatus Kapabacteria bacterium]